jgi:hypothetical protein
MWKKLACLFFILSFVIMMVGCGGLNPIIPPNPDEPEDISLITVTNPENNISVIAGEKNGDKIGVFGEKNASGNLTEIKGTIYISEQGDMIQIISDKNGLPEFFIDSEGNKVIFENYTNSTVDISIYDSGGGLIQGPITVEIDPDDLLDLEDMYNSTAIKKGIEEEDLIVLKWGFKAFKVASCIVSVASGIIPAALYVCGSALISIASEFTEKDYDNVLSTGLGAGGCVIDLVSADIDALFSCGGAIVSIYDMVVNETPVISSLIANPSSVNINETTTITCTASDQDGDILTYDWWIKTEGIFEGSTSGPSTIWKAPNAEGNYTITCTVNDGKVNSETISVIINVIDSCPVPGSIILKATPKCNGTTSQIKLSWWILSSFASSYDVYRNSTLYYSGLTGTQYIDSGNITVGTAYSYYILAENSCGSTASNIVSATAINCVSTNPLGQVQLSSPSNGTTVSTSTVTLSWDTASGATGYEVVYDTSSSFTNPIGWSVLGTSQATGTLTNGTTYYWRVRAFAGSQYSSWSSVWSFTKSGTIVPPTGLVPPSGLSVSSSWNTTSPGFPSMALSWNAVSGATGYDMWVRSSSGSSVSLGTRDAPYVTFNSNSLPGGARYVSGTTYYFKLCTITASGNSAFTSEVPCVAADVNLNHPPVITSTAITSATKGQPYSYNVDAIDSDGDTLTYSLTTTPSGMAINSSTGLITWTPTTSGNYNVTVKVSDVELFDTQSFTVTVEENGTTNQPPTLTLVGNGGVYPGSGTPSTTFTYSIYYSDPEGASPTVGNVYIDGSSHPMSGSGSGSTYTFQISGLSAGTHTYSFQFSDGTYTVNLPSSGTYSAPTVTSTTTNQPPTLTLVGNGGVYPGSGTPSTTFTYSIYYSDPEGASPTVGNVYIDGSSHPMSGSGSGSTYTYQISGLSAGTHTYSFQFSDGTYTVNLPTSGTYSAPTVTQAPQNVTLILYICENSTSGSPLSGVSVGISDGGGNGFSQTTNSSGYVTITGTPGTWSFSASKSGYDTNSWSQSITTNCTKYGYIVKSATPIGTIDVFATLDGSAWIGSLSYSLTGPSSSSGNSVPAILSNKPVGSYSIAFNFGGPSNASLSSITPSSTQTLSTGGITIFTFNFTGSTLPPVPTPLSPGTTSAPGPTISTLTPTLQWQAVSNADYYNLSVSIYPYGTSNIIYYNQQIYGNSITVPSGELEAGKKYRWNMRAYNNAGFSDYSITLYFQT